MYQGWWRGFGTAFLAALGWHCAAQTGLNSRNSDVPRPRLEFFGLVRLFMADTGTLAHHKSFRMTRLP